MSFQDDGYRSGFPNDCPIELASPINGANCFGCQFRISDNRGHWRCDHRTYQDAPGVHWCKGCKIELGTNAESNGWEYCGGPIGACRYDIY